MKAIQIALLISLTALNISPARADETNAAQKDLSLLQGEWDMVSGSADGQSMPEENAKQMKRICKGDEISVMMADQVFLKAKITLDASKKPKTIDYQMTDGFTKGQKQLGIYELEGDTVKFCMTKPGEARPTEFKGGEGLTYSVWKRAKKEASAAAPGLFGGGDGSSFEKAVVINSADSTAGIAAEYQYVASQCGERNKDWTLKQQSLLNHDGKPYDLLAVTLKNGQSRDFYFDISKFFGK